MRNIFYVLITVLCKSNRRSKSFWGKLQWVTVTATIPSGSNEYCKWSAAVTYDFSISESSRVILKPDIFQIYIFSKFYKNYEENKNKNKKTDTSPVPIKSIERRFGYRSMVLDVEVETSRRRDRKIIRISLLHYYHNTTVAMAKAYNDLIARLHLVKSLVSEYICSSTVTLELCLASEYFVTIQRHY